MVHSECTECNKMELPDDVIGDIRKFAKPAFSHWKVFKEAESVIEPRHLKRLREELQGPNAAQVCETLKTYLNDLRALEVSEDNIFVLPKTIEAVWDGIETHNNAQMKEVAQYNELLRSIYGNDFVII